MAAKRTHWLNSVKMLTTELYSKLSTSVWKDGDLCFVEGRAWNAG